MHIIRTSEAVFPRDLMARIFSDITTVHIFLEIHKEEWTTEKDVHDFS